MAKAVTFIHTVASLVGPFGDLAGQLLPGYEVYHAVDESLLTVTRQLGRITPQTRRRLLATALSADDLGVAAILVTCSSIGPIVAELQPFLRAPVFRVDEAMAASAIRMGRRIGVVATLSSTLDPTCALIETTALTQGAAVTVRPLLCDGAFEALARGDVESHDDRIRVGLLELATSSDVIVLAQASMARVVSTLNSGELPPVLVSPRLAVERLATFLREQDITNGGPSEAP